MDDDHDDLDRMLRAAAPRTPVADRAEPAQLDAMIAATRGERGGRITRMPRVAVAGVVAGALVLGGGAAAAASGVLSAYIPNPVLVQTYELPSGAMCTLTMGRMIGGSAEIRDAAREVFAGIAVPSDAEIQRGIDAQRAEQDRYSVAEDGTRTPAYYGTPGYKSADEEYSTAVDRTIYDELDRGLAQRGISLDTPVPFSVAAVADCPGAQW